MAEAQIPDGLSADYVNSEVADALAALQATPDYGHLAAFLTALRNGYLVVDVTGTPQKKAQKKATRIRTIRSTKGQLLLPIFTSMAELRQALAKGARGAQSAQGAQGTKGQAGDAKGAIMPAAEALALIRSDRFVAAEFDAGSSALVVLRKYIDLVLDGEPIVAETVERLR